MLLGIATPCDSAGDACECSGETPLPHLLAAVAGFTKLRRLPVRF